MEKSSVALGDRSLFPELKAKAYLSHAAISPVSSRVKSAVESLLTDYAELGQGAFVHWLAQRERLREKLARLLNAAPEQIALLGGTTHAVREVALCLPWKPGDRVLLWEGEFPANVAPWLSVAKLFELDVRFLPKPSPLLDEDAFLGPLEAALRAGARLVALSLVQFQSGLRLPVREVARLCHERGAELFVDGIQACGVMPVDVSALDIDYFAGGAHKWLMGLEGAGFLYAKPECARAFEARSAGWLSYVEGERFLFEGPGELRYDRAPKPGVQFMEGSSSSAASFAAFEAGIDPILELGPAAIFPHVARYLDELESGAVARGLASLRAKESARRSGILSLVPPAGVRAGDIAARLKERGVFATMPDGCLRFAPHFPNSRAEIPLVLGALDEVLSELRS